MAERGPAWDDGRLIKAKKRSKTLAHINQTVAKIIIMYAKFLKNSSLN